VGSPALTDTLAYSYDHLYRLTSASTPSGSLDTYSYDPAGTRLSRARGAQTDTYTFRADRITDVNGTLITST